MAPSTGNSSKVINTKLARREPYSLTIETAQAGDDGDGPDGGDDTDGPKEGGDCARSG